MNKDKKEPKFKKVFKSAEQASLGISIVVAVLIGVLVGYWLEKITGYKWMLALGIAWGVGAAILNIVKAYKKQRKELDELKDDPKYKYYQQKDDEDDDDKY
jgi:F0F1-type ATP synthase assembly protein I